MTSKVFLVIWEGEEVKFRMNVDEFSFIQFDGWVRSRFGVLPQDKLKFTDDDSAEILLDKTYIENHKSIHIKRQAGAKSATVATRPPSIGLLDMRMFYMAAPVFVALACARSASPLAAHIPITHFCDSLDGYLIAQGVVPRAGVSLEAAIAFVCWATTYLFVRRLLNPETTQEALHRFSADSFYGGLAAAAAVFLKTFLVSRI